MGCNDRLLETDVCCLNPKYGHQGEDGLCVYCGSVPPTWSPWSPWSQCNTLCREGVRTRSRKCQGFSQRVNTLTRLQTVCPGETTTVCMTCSCLSVHGGWSGWSRWSDCSASCISDVIVPIRHSVRSCSRPAPSTDTLPPGNACDGPSRKEKCDSVCPVHGFWTGWSAWSECSSSCIPEGQVPFRAKQRSCSNPAPSSNPPGQPCIGKPTHQENISVCVTVNGHWGEWSAFSSCSVTCGAGLELSVRHCDNPAPKHNGHPCPGERQRTRVCFTNVHCPVDGVWSEWSQWGKCTYPRGKRVINCKDIVGQQDRDRRCDHLSFNGSICSGEMSNDRLCYDVHNCDVMGNWDGWEPWSLCNPTCGKSKRTRKRHCEPDFSNYSKSKRGQKVDTFFGEMLLDCADHKDGDSESQPCLNVPPCS
uniref:Complement factor properdin n=1 Tax=Gouania willdenowi TaxID=441366 RepID=A0A8C5FZF0_GOUWI